MYLLIGAFIAGLLTVLAPCVLPLLPIIIGGSVTGDTKDKRRPLIIAVSLAISLIIFTLLLKATTIFINVPPQFITYFSGGVIIALGILTLFPFFYAKLIAKVGIESSTQKALGKSFQNKNSIVGPIVTGAVLGPVFSSCSPVYAYILASVLPVDFGKAIAYIISYVLGLSLLLLLIGYYGQRFIGKLKFASNPRGWFQKVIGVIFILVGVLVITGGSQGLQTYISEHTPFNFDGISSKFLPKTKNSITSSGLFNIKPYQAPQFTGLQGWINSNPQQLTQLRGKVVLVDFWTYSCINCIRNNPYLENWYNTYKSYGFEVIGIHAPEFSFEKVKSNVASAVMAQHITYPVGLDNNYSTWNVFNNQSWPTSYLINSKGQIVRVHSGEGEYVQEEQAIRQLLTNDGANLGAVKSTVSTNYVPITSRQTPETYLGTQRATDYTGMPALAAAPEATFTLSNSLTNNNWSLGGTWQVNQQQIVAEGNSTLNIKVAGKNVYLVGGSSTPQNITVTLNGKPIKQTGDAGADVDSNSQVKIGASKLYRIVSYTKFTSGDVLQLSVPNGIGLNVFTFGS
jgi:cytochrome c biogenesis protein CcdA/thiol-disulfide isomerase/thioredoxin